jgi:oligopeptide transport system permease protein
MARRWIRAVASGLVTLWAVATGTFLLLENAPGGPASADRRLEPSVEAASLARLGLVEVLAAPCDGTLLAIDAPGTRPVDGATAARIDNPGGGCALFARAGEILLALSRPGDPVTAGQSLLAVRPPLWLRYARTMASLAALDLGVTFTSQGQRTVRENLADGLPVSATVGALALLLALLLGLPGGLAAAARPGSALDGVLSVLATAAISVPAIVLAPLLLYAFALRLPLLPPGGLDGPSGLILPSLTLGLILAGVVQRMTRAGAADFLAGPVARHLAARGLSPARIVLVHGLRHAAVPMLGYLPPAIASLLTGSVVVETVFNLPGIGRYLVGAALNRDHPMVLGVVLVYSALLVVLNTASEALLPVVDPRLRPPAPPAPGGEP